MHERFTLVDGLTRAIPYPNAGWNCNQDYHLATDAPAAAKPAFNPRNVEHCPDMHERFTLVDGLTRAIPYPNAGWNCNQDYHLSQDAPAAPKPAFNPRNVEHCPDMHERFTLIDGRTRAIPYPNAGWNCNLDYHLAQT